QGTVTFTVLNGTTVIGLPVTATPSSGLAKANFSLPAGTAPGSYTIQAAYAGTANFSSSSDTSHTLTVSAAVATTAGANATDTSRTAQQSVTLTATVTSGTVKVNEGNETFTILNGSTVIGSPVTASVVNGAVSTTYTVPGGTAVGSYVIEAEYNGTSDY